jgi:hypothetical protein
LCGTTEFHAAAKLGRADSQKMLLFVLIHFFEFRIHDLLVGLGLRASVSA